MHLSRPVRALGTLTSGAILASALVACSSEEPTAPEAPETPAVAEDTSVPETPSASETTAEEDTESESETATKDSEAKSSEELVAAKKSEMASEAAEDDNASGLSDSVDEAYQIFSPLVPRQLFEEFEDCDPSGLKNSYNCSGPEVGQFQFFQSDSKATQTTQVLTELRSSRVVEDSGDRVVGWSTLGTTAVLTVVDNDKGLVMQQMISTDQEDPEDKLKELGLI